MAPITLTCHKPAPMALMLEWAAVSDSPGDGADYMFTCYTKYFSPEVVALVCGLRLSRFGCDLTPATGLPRPFYVRGPQGLRCVRAGGVFASGAGGQKSGANFGVAAGFGNARRIGRQCLSA